MTATQAIGMPFLPPAPSGQVRAFDLGRDLRPVSRLIREAFSPDLDHRGTIALREMHWMGHFGGLVKFVNYFTGEFNDYFNGFVWEEDGHVIGNITVQPADYSRKRWQIANVAVRREYRGRGIAKQLMNQALHHIKESGGDWAVLQVYEQNEVARHIYEKLGFEYMGGRVDMRLDRVRPHHYTTYAALPVPIDNFQTFSPTHWQELYDLAHNQYGSQAQWWRALRRSDFYMPFENQIVEWFWRIMGKERLYRRCVQSIIPSNKNSRYGSPKLTRRFDAALILTAMRWRGLHNVQLWVRPDQYNQYEESLLQWILHTLQDYPRWPVHINVNNDHERMIDVLTRQGFQQQRTLLTMRRKI
ncbi:MAG: GNAT family N-acetyltransferase [Chloroflexota bacterium]